MYRHDVISDFGFDAGLRRQQIVLNLRTSHKLPIEVPLVLPAAARGVSLSPCLPVFRSHSRRTTVRVARNPAPHTISAPATDAAVPRRRWPRATRCRKRSPLRRRSPARDHTNAEVSSYTTSCVVVAKAVWLWSPLARLATARQSRRTCTCATCSEQAPDGGTWNEQWASARKKKNTIL